MPFTAYLLLQVRNQQGVDANFEIKKSTPLRRLMNVYRRRFVPQGSHLRLLTRDVNMQFTKIIQSDDTADSLGLKQGDLIRAEIHESIAVENMATTSSDEDFLSELRADQQASSSSGGGGR